MDQNKLTTNTSSLELQVQDLKLPSLSDFSRVKVILTVNNYTQCLVYPFKTMTIPSVDDFSVLEISIMQVNSVIAGIEVPLTLFKNKKSQTFKLLSHQPGKKSSPDKPDNNEITLSIKFWPNNSPINAYKEHIKELEKKVKESEVKVDIGMRTQRDLQENFEEITKNLGKMIKNQEETINNLVMEKEKMNEYLKEVEIELKKRSLNENFNEDLRFSGKMFSSEANMRPGRRMKSFEVGKKKMKSKEGDIGGKEYVEKLENEIKNLKVENEHLRQLLQEHQQKVEDLEYKLSEMSVSTSGDKVSEKQSSGLVLSLRGEMSKMAAKYKSRINKLSESRNNLIQENKILIERNSDLEKQLNLSQPDSAKPPEPKPNSYKLLGKYASNIQKVENYLAKSPKPEKDSEPLEKYLQILHTPPSFRKKTPEVKSSRIPKDQVDSLLEDYASKANLPIQFIKETDGIYTFGSKRVFIKLENNKLFVRIGSGFISIEDFIKSYLAVEVEKLNRDKSKELENKNVKFTKIAKEEKFVTCFGVQRRSASASKLPSKAVIFNNN